MLSARNKNENPCEGKPFSSVCQVIIDMKKDIDYSNAKMNTRFKEISKMFETLKEGNGGKSFVDSEIEALSKVQAAGIKMVTKEMEKRVEAFSRALRYKILTTRHEIDVKTDNTLKLASKDVANLRDDILEQFKANKAIFKNGIKHMEAISEENRNVTNYIINLQKMTLEGVFTRKIAQLKAECINEIAAIEGQLNQQVQQNHMLLVDLLKKVQNTSAKRWPSGSYCILANGTCPRNFKTINGHMRAISMYSPNATYLKEAQFGSSKIQCHGRCGKYGHWIGDLYIRACCK